MRNGTFRSVALVALVPLVMAVAGVLVLQSQLRARLVEAVQTRLLAEAQGFAALYDQRRIVALREAIAYRSTRGDPAGSVYVLTDRAGAVLAGNLDGWPDGIAVQDAPQQVQIDGRPFLARAQDLRGGFGLLVGVSLLPVEQTLAQMRRVFAAFGLAMLVAGLAAAWGVARQAQRRTARMNAALAQVGGAGGLGLRMPREGGSEHAELADHIDAMLARIAHLFDAHQRLGNAVAHEMRTPLARIRTRLDALDLDAVARAGLDDEIRATIRLFDSLLSIAQMDAEAGNTTTLHPVDLGQIAVSIVELYQPVAEEEGRRITTKIDPDTQILGDEHLLAQLLSNLIENGLKYTRPGDTITVTVRRDGALVRLRVQDDGPGVDDALREQLFTPFARGYDTGSKPGHGLGLSLVRAIALRHGAIPRAPATEKGFAIEVEALHFSAQE